MTDPTAILRVGLTGGIASGKSTVATFFRHRGALVIDADLVSHELIEPGGSAHEEGVARCGPAIRDAYGRLDRTVLGPLVFGDPQARRDLEAIVHPRVREEIERRIGSRTGGTEAPIAIVDAALLVETGGWRDYHRLVVVSCTPGVQRQRLRERGLADDDIDRRLAAQAPLDAKLAVAHYVIDAETSLARTEDRVAEVWRALLADRQALADGTLD
mgnify:CR=1 FL=1